MTEDKSFLDKAQEVAKDVAEKAKDVATTAKEKVSGYVGDHEDQIHSRIDKTGDFVDDKTKGRFTEKIDKAQDAAKGAVTKIGASGDEPEPEAAAPAQDETPPADTTNDEPPASESGPPA
ncbi:MAG: antitoxin [Acidimicrobiales bacterium]